MNYVLGKGQATLLHAEGVLAESNRDIIRSFILQAGMNPDLKKPVGHIALSYSPVDVPKLTDGKIYVRCGCFAGYIDEFREQVESRHGDSKFAKGYLKIADLVEWQFCE